MKILFSSTLLILIAFNSYAQKLSLNNLGGLLLAEPKLVSESLIKNGFIQQESNGLQQTEIARFNYNENHETDRESISFVKIENGYGIIYTIFSETKYSNILKQLIENGFVKERQAKNSYKAKEFYVILGEQENPKSYTVFIFKM